LKQNVYFGDLGAIGKILLKWIVKKLGQIALGWIEVAHCTEKWKEHSIALLFHKNDLVGCQIRKNFLVQQFAL